MARGSSEVLRQIRTLFEAGTIGGVPDGHFLDRFVDTRDELAFATLVERHGPMVLRVCRGVLGDVHDAEDAFQATFLVLARKARSIRKQASVGPWLHGVAHRISARMKGHAARRRLLNRRVVEQSDSQSSQTLDPTWMWAELHEEVNRLPERYRAPVVLCYLEGLTNEEAAFRLRWPVGTVKVRLHRAREKLQVRLTRRGLAPAVGLLGVTSTADAKILVPPKLIELTVRAASSRAPIGVVTASVISLTEGALRAMLLTKLKLAAVGILSLVTVTIGVGAILGQDRAKAEPDAATLRRAAESDAATDAGKGEKPLPEQSRGRVEDSSAKAEVANRVNVKPPPMLSDDQFAFIVNTDTPSLINVVRDMDRAKLWVLDIKSRTWHTYRAPAGIKIQPFVLDAPNPKFEGAVTFVALEVEGEKITELVAFCHKSKAWVRQALHEPVNGKTRPMLSDEQFALYAMGRYAYAFSALTGTWDSVDLGEMRGPRVEKLSVPGMAIVKGTGPLYAYDARTGRFSDVESGGK
jgi:RNA polymerase sigma factor (sigma-70 family)